jgi:hypothetical protein
MTRLIFLLLRSTALPALLAATTFAQEPAELLKARETYQRDIEFVNRPVNERYLRVLEQLKRSMGTRGDAHGMLAVQNEIDRIDPSAAIQRFVGKWSVTFNNGEKAIYMIDAAGNVTRSAADGARSSAKKSRITAKGADFIVEWKADDRIERLKLSPTGLAIDHFNTDAYPAGAPGLTATGTAMPK